MASVNSPHQMITASRVTGTPVFDQQGERIGHIHDLSIDKVSGQCMYALLSFGGFLGVGEHYQTLPWSALTYHTDRGGYVLSAPKSDFKDAPTLSESELEELGAGQRTEIPPYNVYPVV
jgi:sporulation protein YlmC with PRC-barrel domain